MIYEDEMIQTLFQVGMQIDSQLRNDSNIRTTKKKTNLVYEVKVRHVIVLVGQKNTILVLRSNVMTKSMTAVVDFQIKGTNGGKNIHQITNVIKIGLKVHRQTVIHLTQNMKSGIIEKVARHIGKSPVVQNNMTLLAMMIENDARKNLKKEKDLDQEADGRFHSGNLR